MPVGLDDVSGFAGLVSLSVTLLHGCIQGFVVLSRAKHSGNSISHVLLSLEFEQLKLSVWAARVGLTETPADLRVTGPYLSYVPKVLEQLGELLCDASRLRQRYGLKVEEIPEETIDLGRDESILKRLQMPPSFELQTSDIDTANAYEHRPGPWKKLRWVSGDERESRKLLSDVRDCNRQLQEMLGHDNDKAPSNRIDTIVRTTITNTYDQQDLDLLIEASQASLMKALVAPARVRKKILRLGLLGRHRSKVSIELSSEAGNDDGSETSTLVPIIQSKSAPTKPTPGTRKMSFSNLTLEDLHQPSEPRQLGRYGRRPILLERRLPEVGDWKRFESRASKFSEMLEAMANDPSFHSLQCLGFVKDIDNCRYGYVFDLSQVQVPKLDFPARRGHQRTVLPILQTLHDMLAVPSLRPSLNLRVFHAISLLETIQQLHTAGWLHKELRSQNVFFVGQIGQDQSDHKLLRSSLFVGGYVFARADDSYDYTEPLLPNIEADLYRHPHSSLGRLRQRYCKSFDIFSVGCILLELGMWSQMSGILESVFEQSCHSRPTIASLSISASITSSCAIPLSVKKSNDQDHSTDWLRYRREMLAQLESGFVQRDGIIELLEAQAGETYTRVVVECLTAKTSDWADHSGVDEHGTRYALDLEQRMLAQLISLAQRL